MNTLISWLHDAHVNPWMHGLHTSFGVGAFVGPLIIAIFIEDAALSHSQRLGSSYWVFAVLAVPVAVPLLVSRSPTMHDYDIEHTSTGAEAGDGVTGVEMVVVKDDNSALSAAKRSTEGSGWDMTSVAPQEPAATHDAPAPAPADTAAVAVSLDTPSKPDTPRIRSADRTSPLKFIVMLVFVLFLFVGCELGYGGWLAVYAVNEKMMGESGAANLVGAFWGALTLGRLLAVPISTRVSPKAFLYVAIVGTLVPLLCFSAAHRSIPAAWVCSVRTHISALTFVGCVICLDGMGAPCMSPVFFFFLRR